MATQPRRVRNATARVASRNTRAARISTGALARASCVSPRHLPPSGQTCIPARRTRQRQDARTPISASCVLSGPVVYSVRAARALAGQHARRGRVRGIVNAQGGLRVSANGTPCPPQASTHYLASWAGPARSYSMTRSHSLHPALLRRLPARGASLQAHLQPIRDPGQRGPAPPAERLRNAPLRCE